MDCYIYYKSATQNSEKILACFVQLRQYMSSQLANPICLQQRPVSGELITWMEIYRDIPPDFETILANALTQSSMQEWLIGERRMEYFIDVKMSN